MSCLPENLHKLKLPLKTRASEKIVVAICKLQQISPNFMTFFLILDHDVCTLMMSLRCCNVNDVIDAVSMTTSFTNERAFGAK